MKTLREIKSTAAALPAEKQFALWKWLGHQAAVRQLGVADLRRELQLGVDDLEAGRCVELKGDQPLRDFFTSIKVRGRARLTKAKKAA